MRPDRRSSRRTYKRSIPGASRPEDVSLPHSSRRSGVLERSNWHRGSRRAYEPIDSISSRRAAPVLAWNHLSVAALRDASRNDADRERRCERWLRNPRLLPVCAIPDPRFTPSAHSRRRNGGWEDVYRSVPLTTIGLPRRTRNGAAAWACSDDRSRVGIYGSIW